MSFFTNYVAFKGVPGVCKGTNIVMKEQPKCEDVDSDDPQCTECQKICIAHKDCSGFHVNLNKMNRWSECFLKTGLITVNANKYTKKNNICYRKGDE